MTLYYAGDVHGSERWQHQGCGACRWPGVGPVLAPDPGGGPAAGRPRQGAARPAPGPGTIPEPARNRRSSARGLAAAMAPVATYATQGGPVLLRTWNNVAWPSQRPLSWSARCAPVMACIALPAACPDRRGCVMKAKARGRRLPAAAPAALVCT